MEERKLRDGEEAMEREPHTPVTESLFARKSVRVFTGETISPAKKRLILEAACQAPSAGNQQLYTIIDVTDQALKDTLAVTCDNQPFIAKADMVLIFCAEYFVGSWLQRAGICPWDYTGRPTNVNGLIRLDFAPLWFLTGLLFERISWKGNGKMLEKL